MKERETYTQIWKRETQTPLEGERERHTDMEERDTHTS